MKKQLIILIFICIMSGSGFAQFGIGAGGGIIYPGLSKSDVYGSQFGVGAGFDVFMRHTLLKFSDSLIIDARYSYRNYMADINLPYTTTTRFKFTYLSVGVTMDFYQFSSFNIYGGFGASLCTATASKDYLDETDTLIMPEILLGIEYELSQHYNLFTEIDFQFGEIRIREGSDGSDVLSLNGFRWMIGATMFLTE